MWKQPRREVQCANPEDYDRKRLVDPEICFTTFRCVTSPTHLNRMARYQAPAKPNDILMGEFSHLIQVFTFLW